MTLKDAFTDDEWFLLSSVPAMIGSAMSVAAPSGVVGTVKELSASMKAMVQGHAEHPDSPLIAELLQRAGNWDDTKAKAKDYRERAKARLEGAGVTSREQLHELVLGDCRTAAGLVDERCAPVDAAAYKDWSVTIARKVAEAAKEGGFLGFGGVRVSDEERAVLARIESALGVASGVLVA